MQFCTIAAICKLEHVTLQIYSFDIIAKNFPCLIHGTNSFILVQKESAVANFL